jgi:Sulfotransferase family
VGELVFVSGDFSSGTTLLFTMFRHTERCHCLYEPLHERLLPWLVRPPRAYEGHAFVGSYFAEYKGYTRIPDLFDPEWGVSGLHLSADADQAALYRYLTYIIGTAFGQAPRVVLKENRFAFRLPWLRARFPAARVVHVYRDLDEQWESIVRRVQERLGRADVGQDRVDFMGFRMAAWCDDLEATYPELAAERSSSGYERFSKLWHLSKREQEKYADVSIALDDLRSDFPRACARISDAVGFELDVHGLSALLATGSREPPSRNRLRLELDRLVDRAGARYAEARVSRAARNRTLGE